MRSLKHGNKNILLDFLENSWIDLLTVRNTKQNGVILPSGSSRLIRRGCLSKQC